MRTKKIIVPIEISARHIHVSRKDLETLFGKGYELTPLKPLSQTKQYAAEETVQVETVASWGKPEKERFTFGKTPNRNTVRILGPVRHHTQLEISLTDAINLNIKPQLHVSGDIKGTNQKLVIIGTKGKLILTRGIIVPIRHIHASDKDAQKYGLKDGQTVTVKTAGLRPLIFADVIIRVHETFRWNMHIDVDEANAAGITMGTKGEVII